MSDEQHRAFVEGRAARFDMPHITLRARLGPGADDFGVVIPVTGSAVDDLWNEVHRRRGPNGLDEDYLKRWIGEKVHEVLGDLDDERLSDIFYSFEIRTDQARDGYEVRGFVPFGALEDRPIVPSGSTMFDAVRYAASRLVHRASNGRIGAKDEAAHWQRRYYAEAEARLKAQKELRELKERPENRTVEELAEALRQADERTRFFEREIERNDARYEKLLQRNVWLSERLAEVDPLYREEVERRRKEGKHGA